MNPPDYLVAALEWGGPDNPAPTTSSPLPWMQTPMRRVQAFATLDDAMAFHDTLKRSEGVAWVALFQKFVGPGVWGYPVSTWRVTAIETVENVADAEAVGP